MSDSEESKEESRLYKEPKINKKRCYFQSSMLALKYVNTELEMNEYAHFKASVDIPVFQLKNNKKCNDSVDLMQAELIIKVDLFSSPHDFDEESDDDDEDLDDFDISKLKKIDTVELRINNLYHCKFEYLEVKFSDSNYSQCEGYVTCSLVNFKFSKDIDLEKRIEGLESSK